MMSMVTQSFFKLWNRSAFNAVTSSLLPNGPSVGMSGKSIIFGAAGNATTVSSLCLVSC